MVDIATRMNVDANYASQYRLRLIGADMNPPGWLRPGRIRRPLSTRLPPRARRGPRPLTSAPIAEQFSYDQLADAWCPAGRTGGTAAAESGFPAVRGEVVIPEFPD